MIATTTPAVTGPARGATVAIAQAAVIVLATLAIGYTLYLAAELLVPIAFAGLLSILLAPLVRGLVRWRVPRSVAAGLLVGAVIAVVAAAVVTLSGPAERWLSDAPKMVRQLQKQTVPAKGRMADIRALADEVDELASVESKPRTQTVVVKGPGVLGDFVGGLPVLIAGAVVVTFLTYFLLLSGDSILRRLTMCGRTWTERRRIVTIARRIEHEVSIYLRTVTIINITLGAAVALLMYAIGIPNPTLWGVMVAVLNFAPYVGALTSLLVLSVVGLTHAGAGAGALLVPASFLLLTILEGQVITPMILGRRMALSATIVFLSVVIWGWLWGIAGALMAVPIVTSIKAVCENFPALRFVALFLRVEHPQQPRPEARQPAGKLREELLC